MDAGRDRVADMVRAAMEWKSITGTAIEEDGFLSRSTVDRVKRGYAVSDSALRRLGVALGLPRDFLLYVKNGDLAEIRNAAAHDPDLVRWVEHDLFRNDTDKPRS